MRSQKSINQSIVMDETFEKLSTAVSLTVLEIDFSPSKLIPAFLLANIMSPDLWEWRNLKNAFNEKGILRSPKSRLNQLQRFFHQYSFTILKNEPGGDPWGLISFAEEEKRFGKEFVQNIQKEYDATFRKLLKENPNSQFGQIINQQYYQDGCFPRLKNETLEVMNAFEGVNKDGKKSGKCIGLGMLWAASLVVWGRFPLDRIIISGNRAHMFVFLDIEDGHLLNNTKWFSSTRIKNRSELSEYTRFVASNTESTFFYNPEMGMCHCSSQISQIPKQKIKQIFAGIGDFVSISLKHPNPEKINFIQSGFQIPDPLDYSTPESYRNVIMELGKKFPDSIYDYSLYAFRSLNVLYPQVYIRAALRNYNTIEMAGEIKKLSDALLIISRIKGHESIFYNKDRIMMPDEVIYFNTGDDRDKSLLLFTLLKYSKIFDEESTIGFSNSESYVLYSGNWINLKNFNLSNFKPKNITLLFNANFCERKE